MANDILYPISRRPGIYVMAYPSLWFSECFQLSFRTPFLRWKPPRSCHLTGNLIHWGQETPAISATSWYLWDWSRFTMDWHRSAEICLPQAITQVKLQVTTTTPLIHFNHRPRVINKVSLVDLWTTGAWHCSGNQFFLRCAQSTFVPSLKDCPMLPHFKNIYHIVIYLQGRTVQGKRFWGKMWLAAFPTSVKTAISC